MASDAVECASEKLCMTHLGLSDLSIYMCKRKVRSYTANHSLVYTGIIMQLIIAICVLCFENTSGGS